MSIADQITRLNNAKANIKQAIENKGVTVKKDALLDEYPALIESIEGGGGNSYYEDLYNLRTSNGTNMAGMFAYCTAPELDLRSLDVSKATTMRNMFSSCYQLTSLDVSNFDTSNVTKMDYMFSSCNKLTSLDVSKWDTSNVTSMSYMFSYDDRLAELDLSNFNTSNVTDMSQMFRDCGKLTSLDLSNWDTSKVTNITYMFYNCNSLHTLRLDNCNNDTINKIITSNKFPTKAIDGVTRTIYCREENIGDLVAPTNWVFSFIVDEPEEPDTGDIPLYVPGEFRENSELTEVSTMVTSEHTDLSYMFYSCTNLTTINGTGNWDTSDVNNMEWMFTMCFQLASLDVNSWDTSDVTNMHWMFFGCSSLTELDLSNFNTGKITDMESMFESCRSLTTLDISNFDTSSVTSINGMFSSCTSLQTLRLDNCSNDTVSKIINSYGFPVGNAGTIYCKAESVPSTLPEGFSWTFNYIN